MVRWSSTDVLWLNCICDLTHCMFSAILITGGDSTGGNSAAEVFLPATSASCELPGLVVGRVDHTMAGLLLWRGPAVTRREDTLQEQLQENISQDRVDFNKLNNFFTNPNVVARNLFVCTSLVTISRLFSSLTTITPL